MDVILLDEYVNDRCGEVYLSNDGILIFLCTLCNEAFKGYGCYLEHIFDFHDLPVYSVEDVNDIQEEIHNNNDDNVSSPATIEDLDNKIFDNEVDYNFGDNFSLNESEILCNVADQDKIIVDNVELDQEEECLFVIDEEIEEEQSSSSSLKPHRKNRSADLECPYCKINIKGKSNLDKHILRHNDTNKRYQCSYCPKRFHVRFEKYQHECSHTGERAFLCTECGKGFISNGKLNEHINMIHKNLRPKQCEICNKNFFSNKYLNRHMLVHQSERNHKCDVCDASFKLRKTLIAHKKLHENKLEHECELCGTKFNQRPALHSHMRTRHREMLKSDT